MNVKHLFTVIAAMSIVNLFAGTLKFECSTNREDAIYKAGEKIVFKVKLLDDGQIASDKFIQYQLRHDDKTVKSERVSAAEDLVIETSLNKPGWVYITVTARDGEGKEIKQLMTVKGKEQEQTVRGGIGAMIEPEKLHPFLEEPKDFDAFWDKVKAELAAVPMKELERDPYPDRRAQVFDVKVSCAGDKPVSGYLCIPNGAKPGSCPAIVSFHGAGVYSANRLTWRAVQGFIAMDINAHGIENGKPKAFYEDLRENYFYAKDNPDHPGRYPQWYKTDREKFYFKGMFMRVMRALEYVKSQPEWDGKHLIVMGSSQGGAQVLAACALDHDVTFALAGVPAMCDHSGCLGGRRSGWPFLYSQKADQENPAIVKCASYYDGAYFAKRIKCPIWITTGFIDGTCAPSSVFAAYNNIPDGVEKHIQTCPTSGHGNTPATDWEKALKDYTDPLLKK